MGVTGRYIFTPQIFKHLGNLKPGAGGEFQLTDAIQTLLTEEQVLAYEYAGTRYDCGSKMGLLKANIELGLLHGEIGEDLRAYLRDELLPSFSRAAVERLTTSSTIGPRLSDSIEKFYSGIAVAKLRFSATQPQPRPRAQRRSNNLCLQADTGAYCPDQSAILLSTTL